MANLRKRSLSGLLILCMIFSLIPMFPTLKASANTITAITYSPTELSPYTLTDTLFFRSGNLYIGSTGTTEAAGKGTNWSVSGSTLTFHGDFTVSTSSTTALSMADGSTLIVEDGAEVSFTSTNGTGIRCTGNLTINIKGEGQLTANGSGNASSSGISVSNNLTITGTGKLTADGGPATATAGNSSVSYGIYVGANFLMNGGIVNANGGTASATGYTSTTATANSYGLYVGTKFTINSGTINATAGVATATYSSYNATATSTAVYVNNGTTANIALTGATVGANGSENGSENSFTTNGYVAQSPTVTATSGSTSASTTVQTAKIYINYQLNFTGNNLYIGGTTTGYPTLGVTYAINSGVLTLKEGFNFVTEHQTALELTSTSDRTIIVEADVVGIRSIYNNFAENTHGILSTGNLTIKGSGTLYTIGGTNTGYNESYGIYVQENKNLTLTDGAIVYAKGKTNAVRVTGTVYAPPYDNEENFSIWGRTNSISYSADYNEEVGFGYDTTYQNTIKDGASAITDAVLIHEMRTLYFNPADGMLYTQWNSGTNVYSRPYDRVQTDKWSGTIKDISSSTLGTLTLIEGFKFVTGANTALCFPEGDVLNVATDSVADTSVIIKSIYSSTDDATTSNGILALVDLTIKGDGKIEATSGTAHGSAGINATANLTVADTSTVTATGGNATDSSYGIKIDGVTLTVSGEVTATGGIATNKSVGILGNTFTITGTGTIDADGGDSVDSYGIYASGTLDILGSVTIDADGGTATNKSVGIYSGGVMTVGGGSSNSPDITAVGDNYGIHAESTLSITRGEVTANGGVDGIYSVGNMTVGRSNGNSSPEVTATGTNGNGINVTGYITINDGEVIATGGVDGIYSGDTMTVGRSSGRRTSPDVTAVGGVAGNGINVNSGNFVLNNGTVNAEGYDASDNSIPAGVHGIYINSGNYIMERGTVNANGTTNGIYVETDFTIEGGVIYSKGISNGIQIERNFLMTGGTIYTKGQPYAILVKGTPTVDSDRGEVFFTGWKTYDEAFDDYGSEEDTWEYNAANPLFQSDVNGYYYIVDLGDSIVQHAKLSFEGRTLYFNPHDGTLKIGTNQYNLIPYVDQRDKWSITGGSAPYTLTLSDGFDFTTSASTALVVWNESGGPTGGTITVTGNANLESDSSGRRDSYGIRSRVDLTIDLNDGSVFNVTGGNVNGWGWNQNSSYGILAEGDLKVTTTIGTGTGILNATGGDVNTANGNSYGIYVSGNAGNSNPSFDMSKVNVNATGEDYGIFVATKDFTMNSGTVNAEDAGIDGIYVGTGNFNMVNGTVTADGDECGIQVVAKDFTMNGGIVIATSDDQTVDATAADYKTYGIYVGQALTMFNGTITATGGNISGDGNGSNTYVSYGIYAGTNFTMNRVPNNTPVITATGGSVDVDAGSEASYGVYVNSALTMNGNGSSGSSSPYLTAIAGTAANTSNGVHTGTLTMTRYSQIVAEGETNAISLLTSYSLDGAVVKGKTNKLAPYYYPISTKFASTANGVTVQSADGTAVKYATICYYVDMVLQKNDGTSEKTTQKVWMNTNQQYLIPNNPFTWLGYEFVNWKSDNNVTYYNPGASYEQNRDSTLYAQWNRISVTVSILPSGGSSTHWQYDTYTIPAGIPKDGYVFTAWLGSDGVSYYPGQVVTLIERSLTLTPQWTPVRVTVSFNPNGGSGNVTEETRNQYDSYIIPACEFTRSDCNFSGWLGSDGVLYNVGQIITLNGNLTLTAQWTPIIYPQLPEPQPQYQPDTTWIQVRADGNVLNVVGTITKNGGKSVMNVNAAEISRLITTARGKIVFPFPNDTGSSAVRLTLRDVKLIADKKLDIEVESGNVSYTIPADAIDIQAIMDKFGVSDPSVITFDITINTKLDSATSDLVKNAVINENGALVMPAFSFTVTATYGGQTYEIEEFGGYVTRTIEVTAEQAAKITTAVIVEPDGTLRHVPTNVYEENGRWYVTITNITNSVYTLIHHEKTFDDIKGKWYESSVEEMASRKIINGRNDIQFDGESTITRSEFCAIISRALSLPVNGDASMFNDVSESNWFYGVVGAAYKYGIVTGRDGGKFDPNTEITWQEAMIMIQRAADLVGYKGSYANISSYSDAVQVSGWAEESVRFCVGSGLLSSNNDGKLNPRINITRAETADVILTLLQKANLIDIR